MVHLFWALPFLVTAAVTFYIIFIYVDKETGKAWFKRGEPEDVTNLMKKVQQLESEDESHT